MVYQATYQIYKSSLRFIHHLLLTRQTSCWLILKLNALCIWEDELIVVLPWEAAGHGNMSNMSNMATCPTWLACQYRNNWIRCWTMDSTKFINLQSEFIWNTETEVWVGRVLVDSGAHHHASNLLWRHDSLTIGLSRHYWLETCANASSSASSPHRAAPGAAQATISSVHFTVSPNLPTSL